MPTILHSPIASDRGADPYSTTSALTVPSGGVAVSCNYLFVNRTLTSSNMTLGTQVTDTIDSSGSLVMGTATTTGSLSPNFADGSGYGGASIASVAYSP